MLKKIYKKDGILFFNNDETNIQLLYFIINHYNDPKRKKEKSINQLKKDYYISIGYIY